MIIATYLNMPKVTATPLKKLYECRFREAVRYAQEIMRNPETKAAHEMLVAPGRKLFNVIISAYLKNVKAGLPGKLL